MNLTTDVNAVTQRNRRKTCRKRVTASRAHPMVWCHHRQGAKVPQRSPGPVSSFEDLMKDWTEGGFGVHIQVTCCKRQWWPASQPFTNGYPTLKRELFEDLQRQHIRNLIQTVHFFPCSLSYLWIRWHLLAEAVSSTDIWGSDGWKISMHTLPVAIFKVNLH